MSFSVSICVLLAFGQAAYAQNVLHWDWHRSTHAQKSISQLNLSRKNREAIKKAIAVQLREQLADSDASTDEELEQMASKVKAELVDLTGRGKHDVITQGPSDIACSPTGNCLLLVFQESGGRYKLLLARDAAQTFTIQPNRTNGFNDIVLYQHGSAFDGGARLYEFRDGAYHDTACFNVRWSETEDDTVHQLKEPRFTPCKR